MRTEVRSTLFLRLCHDLSLMPRVVHTTRFTRGKLPHGEVENGRYFVTVRCHDSLPTEAVARLAEIHATLQSTEAQSEQFAAEQRRYFQTMER